MSNKKSLKEVKEVVSAIDIETQKEVVFINNRQAGINQANNPTSQIMSAIGYLFKAELLGLDVKEVIDNLIKQYGASATIKINYFKTYRIKL